MARKKLLNIKSSSYEYYDYGDTAPIVPQVAITQTNSDPMSIPLNNITSTSPRCYYYTTNSHYYILRGKKPTIVDNESLKYGEIAINYVKNFERIFIRNTNDEIVQFEPFARIGDGLKVTSPLFKGVFSGDKVIMDTKLSNIIRDILTKSPVLTADSILYTDVNGKINYLQYTNAEIGKCIFVSNEGGLHLDFQSYLPLTGGTMSGDISFLKQSISNKNSFINFKYSNSGIDSYSWRLGYQYTRTPLDAQLIIQNSNGRTWNDVLTFNLDNSSVFNGNIKPSINETYTIGTSSSDQFLKVFSKEFIEDNVSLIDKYALKNHTHNYVNHSGDTAKIYRTVYDANNHIENFKRLWFTLNDYKMDGDRYIYENGAKVELNPVELMVDNELSYNPRQDFLKVEAIGKNGSIIRPKNSTYYVKSYDEHGHLVRTNGFLKIKLPVKLCSVNISFYVDITYGFSGDIITYYVGGTTLGEYREWKPTDSYCLSYNNKNMEVSFGDENEYYIVCIGNPETEWVGSTINIRDVSISVNSDMIENNDLVNIESAWCKPWHISISATGQEVFSSFNKSPLIPRLSAGTGISIVDGKINVTDIGGDYSLGNGDTLDSVVLKLDGTIQDTVTVDDVKKSRNLQYTSSTVDTFQNVWFTNNTLSDNAQYKHLGLNDGCRYNPNRKFLDINGIGKDYNLVRVNNGTYQNDIPLDGYLKIDLPITTADESFISFYLDIVNNGLCGQIINEIPSVPIYGILYNTADGNFYYWNDSDNMYRLYYGSEKLGCTYRIGVPLDGQMGQHNGFAYSISRPYDYERNGIENLDVVLMKTDNGANKYKYSILLYGNIHWGESMFTIRDVQISNNSGRTLNSEITNEWVISITNEHVEIKTGICLLMNPSIYNHRHHNVTQTVDGFMSKEDKQKIDDLTKEYHYTHIIPEEELIDKGSKGYFFPTEWTDLGIRGQAEIRDGNTVIDRLFTGCYMIFAELYYSDDELQGGYPVTNLRSAEIERWSGVVSWYCKPTNGYPYDSTDEPRNGEEIILHNSGPRNMLDLHLRTYTEPNGYLKLQYCVSDQRKGMDYHEVSNDGAWGYRNIRINMKRILWQEYTQEDYN